jgi:hypothetical protein
LSEILSWPKAQKHFHHDNEVDPPEPSESLPTFGPTATSIASPENFICNIYSQRDSLEELLYNNEFDGILSDGTTFDRTLREFCNLKRVALTLECLLTWERVMNHEDISPHLFEVLPPALEELVINLDDSKAYF